MKWIPLAFAASLILGLASAASAQQPTTHESAILDLTMARHVVNGGFIEYPTGVLLDALLAGSRPFSPRSAFVIGAGAGIVVGGFGDRCLIRPSGGCAPKGNFVTANVLAGVDASLGSASSRLLVGPTLYDGASATSLGAQVRADVLSPPLAHLGLGLMARATWLPSHGGESLVAWAVGGSLTIR